MRLVSLLSIIMLLGGCPLALEVPDGSLPDIDNDAGANPDGKAGPRDSSSAPSVGGASGSAQRPDANYDAGVPMGYDGGNYVPERDINQDPQMRAPAHVRLLLTDAPADLQALWVAIPGIEAHVFVNGQEQWLRLPVMPQRFDLLSLRDGKTAVLFDALVPPAAYKQLRVHVGREATAVVGDEQHPLPLAPEVGDEGVLVDGGFEAQPGLIYTVVLDFDALASIQMREQGPVLVPVIRIKEITVTKSDEAVQPMPIPDGGMEMPEAGDAGTGDEPMPGTDAGEPTPSDDVPPPEAA